MKTDKEKYEEFLAGLEELSLRTDVMIDADDGLFIRIHINSYVSYEIEHQSPNWAGVRVEY